MGNEAEKLDTDVIEDSGVEEEVEASTESTDEAETQETEVEAWMQEEDQTVAEEPEDGKPKKLSTKAKLRGKVEEANQENERLRAENEALKRGQAPAGVTVAKRPRLNDFDSDEDYETAMDTWEEAKETNTLQTIETRRDVTARQQQHRQVLTDAVDAHYERAQELVTTHSINPEVYQKADATVRQSIESVAPGQGEVIVNQLISLVGEGSEKVMYHLGVNKAALNELRAILQDDPSGLKAAAFIGQKKAEITGPKHKLTSAPKPVAQINGETVKASASKKAYDKAHKEGRGQDAFNIKSEARKAGTDTKGWV
jgi:hypothetical protein